VAQLRAQQLLRSDPNGVQLYHDRLRPAVLLRLDTEQRRRRHEQLAVALESVGADAEVLLAHWRGANQPVRAAMYAVQAAEHAMKALAFARAGGLYAIALELDAMPNEAGTLHERRGDALANAGRPAESADAYLGAVRYATGAKALDLRRRAAEQLLAGAYAERGFAVLDELLAAVGLRRQRTRWGALLIALWLRLRLRWRGLDFTVRSARQVDPDLLQKIDVCGSIFYGLAGTQFFTAFEFHTRRLLYLLDAGEPVRLAEAITVEIAAASSIGRASERRVAKLLAIAQQLAADIQEPTAHARIVMMQGMMTYAKGRWRESERLLRSAEQTLRNRCTGAMAELRYTSVRLFCTRLCLGDIETLRTSLPEMVQHADERGELYAQVWFRSSLSVVVRLADDKVDEARHQLAHARAMRDASQAADFHSSNLYAAATLALYDQDGGAAWREITDRAAMLEATNSLRQEWMSIFYWELRGRCALAASTQAPVARRRHLLAEVKRAARRLERKRSDWAQPLAQMLRAGLAVVDGERDRAGALWAAAARGFEAADMELHAAVARRRLGELEGGADDGAEWFRAQRIRDPEKFAYLFAPLSFPRRQGTAER
jgi:hypothetical protein